MGWMLMNLAFLLSKTAYSSIKVITVGVLIIQSLAIRNTREPRVRFDII